MSALTSSVLSFEGGQVYITGGRGPVGPAGPAGSAEISKQSGEDIIVNRLVYSDGDLVYHADPTDPDKASGVIGLATQSVSSGGNVTILTFGARNDGSWSWPTSGDLYLGTGGALTTTAPTSGTVLKVGVIASPTDIIINIQQPITII